MEAVDYGFDASLANCRGKNAEVFFPSRNVRNVKDDEDAKKAVEICGECQVRRGCLDYAIRYEAVGIWGGATELQRELLRRKRGIQLPLDRCASPYVLRASRNGRVDRLMRTVEELEKIL